MAITSTHDDHPAGGDHFNEWMYTGPWDVIHMALMRGQGECSDGLDGNPQCFQIYEELKEAKYLP